MTSHKKNVKSTLKLYPLSFFILKLTILVLATCHNQDMRFLNIVTLQHHQPVTLPLYERTELGVLGFQQTRFFSRSHHTFWNKHEIRSPLL